MNSHLIKKAIYLSLAVLFSFSIQSFAAGINNSKDAKSICKAMRPDVPGPKKKIRIALRHHGTIDPQTGQPTCVCPGCKIPSCPCPIGICGAYGFVDNALPLSQLDLDLQSENELGTADIGLIDNTHMLIEFDQPTGYDNGQSQDIIEFLDNYTLTNDLATALNKNSIVLTSGTYNVTYEGDANGYIVVDCITN